MLNNLSVFIICRNEEKRIGRAIDSVKDWVSEVIIVDSGSTDKTLEICKNKKCKIFHNDWPGYGQQKIFAQEKCQNNWILNIDADEEISVKLKDEIIRLFADNHKLDKHSAYQIPLVDIPNFVEQPSKFSPKKLYIRLYNRENSGFRNHSVHDVVVVKKGSLGKLGNLIIHRSYLDLEHAVGKINFYSSMQAQNAFSVGKKISVLKIIMISFISFWKNFWQRRFFLYGFDGYIYSKLYAFSRFIKYAKIREQYQKNRNKSL